MTVRRAIGQGFGFGIGCLLLGVAIVVVLIAIGSGARNGAVGVPAPVVTPAPAPPSRTLLTLAGSGIQRSERFTATRDWRIDYAFDCGGQDGIFQIFVYAADGAVVDVAANSLAPRGKGSQPEYRPGTFYLEVNSVCAWNIGVAG